MICAISPYSIPVKVSCMSHKQSMNMLLTAWNASRAISIRAHLITFLRGENGYLITLLRGENGYRVPFCEITKGKTVSPEQFKRVLWK